MSRNSKRLQPSPNSEYVDPAPEKKERPEVNPEKNAFNLSFVVPTEDVTLPSRGKFYPVSSPVHNRETVEIKFMTAKEEDILSSNAGKEGSFDKLIDSLLLTEGIQASDFLEEDKMAILLSARRSGYGPEYETDVFCDTCKEHTPHKFDLAKVAFKDQEGRENNYDAETNTFRFLLPITKIEVQLLNISPEDNEDIETERKQKRKYKLPFNFTVSFLKTAIVSANGITNRREIENLLEVLPAADAKEILNFYSTCRPTIDTNQETVCSVCENVSEREVPLSWAFFRTDV